MCATAVALTSQEHHRGALPTAGTHLIVPDRDQKKEEEISCFEREVVLSDRRH